MPSRSKDEALKILEISPSIPDPDVAFTLEEAELLAEPPPADDDGEEPPAARSLKVCSVELRFFSEVRANCDPATKAPIKAKAQHP